MGRRRDRDDSDEELPDAAEELPEKPARPLTSAEDLAVASALAQTRGLPPELRYEQVKAFLEPLGYAVTNETNWSRPASEQPQIVCGVVGHTEFGGHTQYEFKCELAGGPARHLTWATIRRLAHMREGVHDLVKSELQGKYDAFFGKTPFAHYMAPAGTTERLHAWMRSLASCINAGAVSPRCAANILCVLDAPGTEVHPLAEALPVTSTIFGGSGFADNPTASAAAVAAEMACTPSSSSAAQAGRRFPMEVMLTGPSVAWQ